MELLRNHFFILWICFLLVASHHFTTADDGEYENENGENTDDNNNNNDSGDNTDVNDEGNIETTRVDENVPDDTFAWENSGFFEGDIVFSSEDGSQNGLRKKAARWPNGVIPYFIDSSFTAQERDVINGSISEFHRRTCIRFRLTHKNDRNWLEFKSDGKGCSSFVGKEGGRQFINLNKRVCVNHGTIVHEIMHALGFHHQQSATNRDKYVRILYENIRSGQEKNFEKYGALNVTDFGIGYDYRSIMHYSSKAFSKNGRPTIVPVKEDVALGQNRGLSTKDVSKISAMYESICSISNS